MMRSCHVGSLRRLQCHTLCVVNCTSVIASKHWGTESTRFDLHDAKSRLFLSPEYIPLYLCIAISAAVYSWLTHK